MLLYYQAFLYEILYDILLLNFKRNMVLTLIKETLSFSRLFSFDLILHVYLLFLFLKLLNLKTWRLRLSQIDQWIFFNNNCRQRCLFYSQIFVFLFLYCFFAFLALSRHFRRALRYLIWRITIGNYFFFDVFTVARKNSFDCFSFDIFKV